MARILKKRDLTDITSLFVVEAPLVARNAQPGQFVILRVHEEGERVPVTITDFDRAAGTVTIVVQEVGKTTRAICALAEGGEILDFVGPLGRPAPLPQDQKEGRVALVGGGFGAAAIYSLARELKARGVEVASIVGARTRDLLILTEEVEAQSHRLYLCTDDGSLGYNGFVTGQLEELLQKAVPGGHTHRPSPRRVAFGDSAPASAELEGGAGFTAAFAIGPMPMMRALAETTRPYGLPTWVSLDPIMVDGTGMCGACRVTIDGHTRFACIDGPFFDAHKVDFAEAVVRSKIYAEEQELALKGAA